MTSPNVVNKHCDYQLLPLSADNIYRRSQKEQQRGEPPPPTLKIPTVLEEERMVEFERGSLKAVTSLGGGTKQTGS